MAAEHKHKRRFEDWTRVVHATLGTGIVVWNPGLHAYCVLFDFDTNAGEHGEWAPFPPDTHELREST